MLRAIVRPCESPIVSHDDQLQARVQQALADSPILGLRRLTVQQQDNALCISGSVSSFYLKQLAQEFVRTLAGEIELVNQIDVRS